MQIRRKAFIEVPQFSDRDVAYATADERLRPFYQYDVNLENFAQLMEDKAKDDTDRTLLVDELELQYAQLPTNEKVNAQLKQLRSADTFTVITAHQPSLFTGPLYFIYKICSTINLARQLNAAYPNKHIVPVFVTGGEDHDFEEINHTMLFGNKLEWHNDEQGAVGAMSTDSLKSVLESLKEILGDRASAQSIYKRISEAFTKHKTYGMATLAFVHDLFGNQGLVVADLAKVAFKRAFIPHIKKEIFEQCSKPLVEVAQKELEAVGFSAQAHAREINFFYLRDGLRARIVYENEQYKVLNTDYSFSKEALEEEIEQHPEFFSPNVVMRPVFQEFIMPNLAYIGGGGELAYWLERKQQFAAFERNFPMLIRRNSVLWIDKGNQKKLAKAGIQIDQLFGDVELLIRDFVEQNSDNELSLAEELKQLELIFQSISEKAKGIDPNLAKAVQAEHSRQSKTIENLEGRIRRTEKQRFDVTIKQIRALKDKLFPANGLQERKDNFLNIYLQEGDELFDILIDELNPLEPGFVIIEA